VLFLPGGEIVLDPIRPFISNPRRRQANLPTGMLRSRPVDFAQLGCTPDSRPSAIRDTSGLQNRGMAGGNDS